MELKYRIKSLQLKEKNWHFLQIEVDPLILLYKKVKSIYFEDHSRKFVDKAWHSRKERVLELYKSANIELNWW